MSIRGKGWDDLSESDRDRFLLAAVGGMEEWQSVMRDIGLDANAATKVATSISPIMAAPRFEEERRERERAALSFHGSRPMGQALRAALLRRDFPIAAGEPDSTATDRGFERPRMSTAPDRLDHPRPPRGPGAMPSELSQRPRWLADRRAPAVAWAATILTLGTTAMSRRLQLFPKTFKSKAGRWEETGRSARPSPPRGNRSGLADIWHRTTRLVDRLRPIMRESVQILSQAVAPVADSGNPEQPQPERGGHQNEERQVFDGGWTGDGETSRDDLKEMEAALVRWRGMGPVLKDMTVASALRGYPPALAFIRLITPHVRPAASPAPTEDIAEWDAEEIRHRRMQRALERERALMFRLFWRLFPPIG